MAKCPICHGDVKTRAENKAFPFCSARCKTIDLGKWLSEEYRLPATEGDEHEDGSGADDGSSPEGDMRH